MVLAKKAKRAQAAIEFLMTYGWMLLVVLIVGALIFSFVDFGSLLPNKIEFSNDIRAEQTGSFARTGTDPATESHVVITFTYAGAKPIVINASNANSVITSEIDPTNSCRLVWVKNTDIDSAAAQRNSNGGPGAPGGGNSLSADQADSVGGELTEVGLTAGQAATTDEVIFLNGQTGVLVYDCRALNGDQGLLENDVLEGDITLVKKTAKTGVPVPSTGPIRLSVQS